MWEIEGVLKSIPARDGPQDLAEGAGGSLLGVAGSEVAMDRPYLLSVSASW